MNLRFCKLCGMEFLPRFNYTVRKIQQFCSLECSGISRRIYDEDQYAEASRLWRKDKLSTREIAIEVSKGRRPQITKNHIVGWAHRDRIGFPPKPSPIIR